MPDAGIVIDYNRFPYTRANPYPLSPIPYPPYPLTPNPYPLTPNPYPPS